MNTTENIISKMRIGGTGVSPVELRDLEVCEKEEALLEQIRSVRHYIELRAIVLTAIDDVRAGEERAISSEIDDLYDYARSVNDLVSNGVGECSWRRHELIDEMSRSYERGERGRAASIGVTLYDHDETYLRHLLPIVRHIYAARAEEDFIDIIRLPVDREAALKASDLEMPF